MRALLSHSSTPGSWEIRGFRCRHSQEAPACTPAHTSRIPRAHAWRRCGGQYQSGRNWAENSGGRAANCRERATVKAQRITHVIESDRMGQLRVELRDNMAPRGKRPARFVHPRFSRQLRHEMGRNEIAELTENAELGCRLCQSARRG